MAHPQTWDPERYARNARFVAELGAPVVDLLAPRAGERILDLGCGDGAKVIAGVRRALKPHGRFVAEFGGHGCVAKIRNAEVGFLLAGCRVRREQFDAESHSF